MTVPAPAATWKPAHILVPTDGSDYSAGGAVRVAAAAWWSACDGQGDRCGGVPSVRRRRAHPRHRRFSLNRIGNQKGVCAPLAVQADFRADARAPRRLSRRYAA